MGKNLCIIVLLIVVCVLGFMLYQTKNVEAPKADVATENIETTKTEEKTETTEAEKVLTVQETVDAIEKSFAEEYLDKNDNVDEYEITDVIIYSSEDRKPVEEMDPEYKDKDLLLAVRYDVKPSNGMWAGDAEEIDGRDGWFHSGQLATYDDGKIEIVGTGW